MGGLFIMNKTCTKCKIEKSFSEFNIRTVKGIKKPFSYCKPCEREYNNNRHSHTCIMCKKTYNSGRKESTYCKKCHDEYKIKTYSKLGKIDLSGERNGMYGRQRFGKENPNYNPNKTDEEREKERLVEGYGIWRNKVFHNDKFTCQCCGDKKGGNLTAHHLDSWDWCKDKRLDIDNGITLCKPCHKDFHDKYGYGKNTRNQFYEHITYLKKKNA